MRFLVVIGLLFFTAHRSPAPVVEGPPPFKRTFFTLKGHAVDTFANEKKLPPELAPAFSHASVLATKPLARLTELMGKFGSGDVGTVLNANVDGGERSPEMQRREAAIQKILKSQLKKIAANPILPMAAGLDVSNITFSPSELPSAFFAEGAWSITTAHPEDLLTKGVKRPNRTRLEIPFSPALQLFRYATNKDIEIMRRASENAKIKLDREIALLRFYTEACRGGAPQRLLPIRVTSGGCGDGGAEVTAEPPPLQIRVVVLENIRDSAIELGQFHFRMLDPGEGILTVRTRAENETLLATMNAESEVWYKPRIVKPGEKVIIPLELLFKPSHSPSTNDSGDGACSYTGPSTRVREQTASRPRAPDGRVDGRWL